MEKFTSKDIENNKDLLKKSAISIIVNCENINIVLDGNLLNSDEVQKYKQYSNILIEYPLY